MTEKAFSSPFLSFYIYNEDPRLYLGYSYKGMWIRLFRDWWGISIKKGAMIFSERNSYKKYITLFGYRVSILKPVRNKRNKP